LHLIRLMTTIRSHLPRTRSILLVCLLVFLSIEVCSATDEDISTAILQTDSLWQAGLRDSAMIQTEALLVRARAEGESLALGRILLRRGSRLNANSDLPAAEVDLREAISILGAFGDSVGLCKAIQKLGSTVEHQGRAAEAQSIYGDLFTVAESIGDPLYTGYGLNGMAWQSFCEGRSEEAVSRYRRAILLFREAENPQGEAFAESNMGNALRDLGDYRESAASQHRARAIARKDGFPSIESMALNNLACIEYLVGDPGIALQQFESALAIDREVGRQIDRITPTLNIVLCLQRLGRFDRAEEMLQSALTQTIDTGNTFLQGAVLDFLGRLNIEQGHYGEAKDYFRQVLEIGNDLRLTTHIDAYRGLSMACMEQDSVAVALTFIEDALSLIEDGAEQEQEPLLRLTYGEALASAGRFRDALRQLHISRTRASQRGFGEFVLRAWIEIAGCHRNLSESDSALIALQSGAEIWESERSLPLDPEWREQRGILAHALYADLGLIQLAVDEPQAREDRIRRAFDRLQIFKARTLIERMLGPGEDLVSWDARTEFEMATLERLQQEVLGDGELFVDVFVGLERGLLFAVTQAECRAIELPATADLWSRLRRYRELLASPAPGNHTPEMIELLRVTDQEIIGLLFHGWDDLLRASRRVILSPDGFFNLIPLTQLSLEDQSEAEGQREWTRVPSATILSWLHGRDPGGEGTDWILALAGRDGDTGDLLTGALREIRTLESRYQNIRVQLSPDSNAAPELPIFGEEDVLHFASHVRIDDQNPWQSVVQLRPDQEVGNLYAQQIAAMDLAARLVVLSGCESAGGRFASGEGVLGLTSAFLSAGVPAVIASLWPVDDETTANLMLHFYDELASGFSSATALRQAQNAVQADLATRHPFFWAGFVLVGDGDVKVTLERRSGETNLFVIGLVLLAGTALLLGLRRWTR
jgi:tetratricopeptide (TPR) repeat protein